MKHITFVFSALVILALLPRCNDHERYNIDNSVIEFAMSYASSDSIQFVTFYRNFQELLHAFSNETHRFKVKNSDDSVLSATHLVTLNIDQINLLDIVTYKHILDSINPIIDKKVSGAEYIPFPGGSLAGLALAEKLRGLIQQGIVKGTYAENPIPMFRYSLTVLNCKDRQVVFSETDTVQTFSNVAIYPNEQLGQLLAILDGKIRDELPYFNSKH
jgi:hypothetical protein